MQSENEEDAAASVRDPAGQREQDQPGGAPKRATSGVKVTIAVMLVLAIAAGYHAWSSNAALHPSTTDANLGAYVMRVSPEVTRMIAAAGVELMQFVLLSPLLLVLRNTAACGGHEERKPAGLH